MVSVDIPPASRPRGRHLFLAGVCLFALFAGIGRVSMWEPDEARFAEATRQMLARGDVLTPWFNDRPRFEKPVGLYWLQLPFFAVLGSSELAARLPVALAGAGCVLFTYLIGRRLFGGQAAWIAALALVTCFRIITHARQGLTDIPALLFQMIAMHGFLRAYQDVSPGRAWMAGWGAIGLAALSKGPVAAIPLVVWAVYLTAMRDWSGLRRLRIVPGVLVAAAIAAPWYVYMVAVHGQAFVDVALVSEVVSRAGGDVGPRRGLLYYFDVWPADLLPWTPFFLLALGYFALARARLNAGERRAALFPAVWFLVVVGTFSLSRSKLPHYILPAYPAAALLVGLFIDRARTDAAARRLWWAGAGLVVTVLLAASVLTWALLRRTAGTAMALPVFALPLLLMGGGVITVLLGRRRGPVAGSAAIAGTLASAVAYASMFVIPHLQGLEPIPPLGRSIAAIAERGDRVGQYGTFVSGGLVFYSGHRVDMLVTYDDVARFLSAPGRAFCVLPRRDVTALTGLLPPGALHEIAQQPRLVVRFDRLFGDRSPYEEPMVLVSNQATHPADRTAGDALPRTPNGHK